MNDKPPIYDTEAGIALGRAFHDKRDTAENGAENVATGADGVSGAGVPGRHLKRRTGILGAITALLAVAALAFTVAGNSDKADAAVMSGSATSALQLVGTQTGHITVTQTHFANGFAVRQTVTSYACSPSWTCVETDETVTVWTNRTPAITRSATIRTFPFGWVHVRSSSHLPVDLGTNANRLHEHWLACYLHVGDTSVIACPGTDRYRVSGYPSYTAPRWAYPHGTWPTGGTWHYYTS